MAWNLDFQFIEKIRRPLIIAITQGQPSVIRVLTWHGRFTSMRVARMAYLVFAQVDDEQNKINAMRDHHNIQVTISSF